MRSLSANLTTAQQAQSRTSYITIDLTSHDGDTTLSFKTTDVINKVLNVKQAEGRFGGQLSSPGGGEPYSALIILRDADGSIGAADRRGYRVDIGWGLNTAGGDEVSKSEAVFVWRQRRTGSEGNLLLELYCVSLWDLTNNRWLSNSTAGPLKYEADITIRHMLMSFLGDFQVAAAIRDDGGVFTDFTTAANSPKPGDLGSIDDIGVLSASPQINDAFYFGFSKRFVGISIDITTPAVGGTDHIITWEYWNGASWAALSHPEDTATSNVNDGTNRFITGELKIVTWTHPGTGWATTTVNSQGPFFYVRARVTTAGTHAATTATKITITDKGFNVALDSATGTTGEDFKPRIIADYRQTDLTYAQLLLNFTTLGMTVKNDGFHAIFVDNAQASPDYTYDTSHNVYSDVSENALILPNRYEYVSSSPLNLKVTPKFTGNAENTASQGAWGGTYTALIVEESITSGTVADDLAQRHIDRNIRDSAQGTVLAPMNVGQEIWDLVQVNDIWTGVNNQGRVAHIVREYAPGVYQIELTLGGYVGITQIQDGADLEELERERVSKKLFEIVEAMAQLDSEVRLLRRSRLPIDFGQEGVEVITERAIPTSIPRQVPDPDAPIRTLIGPPIPLGMLPVPGSENAPTIEEVRRSSIAPPQRRSLTRRILDLFNPEDVGE